ncbi:MAG: acyl-CoA dehydrogenase family protein [Chloroflexi bacterium]|nr:acyl-CoA dehydrogenase family protein [Chloroflexota bacterium]
MDFTFTAEQETWRNEISSWIDDEFGSGWAGLEYDEADQYFDFAQGVRAKLAAKKWSAPAWPEEYGGMGLSFVEQAIFSETLAYRRVPGPDLISAGYVGPTLLVYGTDEQKEQYLDDIVNARVTWCQGYSEPGSGSDLASLQTRAVRDGDDYVINGQKIWTSQAHKADWMFILVRTDPDAPKHRGITYLLLDMKTPGVTVRPLTNMLGGHGFNEVFFEDVRVPVKNRVGEENRGWYVGMATMDFERSALSGSAAIRRNFEDFARYLRENPQLVDDRVKAGCADVAIGIELARLLSLRVLSMQQGGLAPNHEASVAKLFSSELGQRFSHFCINVMGPSGQLRKGDGYAAMNGWFTEQYMSTVPSTIAGGTSEIQRGIIATRGLGMPRA